MEKRTLWKRPVLENFVQMLKSFNFIEGNGNSLGRGILGSCPGRSALKAVWKVQVAQSGRQTAPEAEDTNAHGACQAVRRALLPLRLPGCYGPCSCSQWASPLLSEPLFLGLTPTTRWVRSAPPIWNRLPCGQHHSQ